jgi:hypothetical protein
MVESEKTAIANNGDLKHVSAVTNINPLSREGIHGLPWQRLCGLQQIVVGSDLCSVLPKVGKEIRQDQIRGVLQTSRVKCETGSRQRDE